MRLVPRCHRTQIHTYITHNYRILRTLLLIPLIQVTTPRFQVIIKAIDLIHTLIRTLILRNLLLLWFRMTLFGLRRVLLLMVDRYHLHLGQATGRAHGVQLQ